MTINGKQLCSNCFNETPEGAVCGHCGYSGAAGPVGTILLGRYIIGMPLGKGGFGVTYLAYDNAEDVKTAIKEFLPEAVSYRAPKGESAENFHRGVKKFYEEARTLSRFNGNPGLIQVHKFFYENNTAYFAMEFLEGCDLKRHIQNCGGRLSERQVLEVVIPLVDSLIIVHSIGVLHRDISPDNIYITREGQIKLLDFGAARQVLGEASRSLSVILKQGFAPIEQYQTRGKQGPWTDIYALGATIYYCLTGVVPEAPMDRLEQDRVVMPTGISDALKYILYKMMAIRAVDRYQDAMELKRDMLAYGLAGGYAAQQAGPAFLTTSPAAYPQLNDDFSFIKAVSNDWVYYIWSTASTANSDANKLYRIITPPDLNGVQVQQSQFSTVFLPPFCVARRLLLLPLNSSNKYS